LTKLVEVLGQLENLVELAKSVLLLDHD